ncbi:MAG: PEP/pyruvate-binding domain-containing protein [Dehalococcoidia bacterium]
MRWIYWLDEIGQEHNNIVGKKCASMGEMRRAGMKVPPGFVLSLEAYERFMKETGAGEELRKYFSSFSADSEHLTDMAKYEEASRAARGIMESKDMPKDMEKLIIQYYDELCQTTGIDDVPVSTRSAGPASHPGQYETYCYVMGKSEVIRNIIRVWSSTFNQRSIVARARSPEFKLEYDPIGVAVPKMVNAKASGVMFTVHPVTGDPSKVCIQADWGLGESVVSGEVTPDEWEVDKVVLEITHSTISPKLKEYVLDIDAGCTAFLDVPPERQNIPCLAPEEIQELAKTGKRLESYFGCYQDTEWAIDNDLPFPDNIFMLQCRPEQVWNKQETGSKVQTTGSNISDIARSMMGIKK